MGKDILTPNKIQTHAERDYSTPKAHCDLNVLQEAEEKNSLSKINAEHDPEYVALLDEKSKMQQEGILANKKPQSNKPFERKMIETFLINREFNIDEKKGQYIDQRGHIRTEKERKYPVDAHLLKKICAMHPIVKSVHKLVSVCRFHKKVYSRLSTHKATVRKAINKEMMIKIADILELDDWRILIDREGLDALSKKEARIKKIQEDMKDYRSKIQDLQKELKKQGDKNA
tara:strand:+ start:1491 stop:2180 length:690 start_codon:yes stop_codon:yes gene_type:complete